MSFEQSNTGIWNVHAIQIRLFEQAPRWGTGMFRFYAEPPTNRRPCEPIWMLKSRASVFACSENSGGRVYSEEDSLIKLDIISAVVNQTGIPKSKAEMAEGDSTGKHETSTGTRRAHRTAWLWNLQRTTSKNRHWT